MIINPTGEPDSVEDKAVIDSCRNVIRDAPVCKPERLIEVVEEELRNTEPAREIESIEASGE